MSCVLRKCVVECPRYTLKYNFQIRMRNELMGRTVKFSDIWGMYVQYDTVQNFKYPCIIHTCIKRVHLLTFQWSECSIWIHVWSFHFHVIIRFAVMWHSLYKNKKYSTYICMYMYSVYRLLLLVVYPAIWSSTTFYTLLHDAFYA